MPQWKRQEHEKQKKDRTVPKQGQQFVTGPGGVRLLCTKCGYEFEGSKKLQGCNCINTPGCKGRVRAVRPSEVDE